MHYKSDGFCVWQTNIPVSIENPFLTWCAAADLYTAASTTYDKEIDDEQQMLFLSQRNKSDHAPDTEYEDNSSHK